MKKLITTLLALSLLPLYAIAAPGDLVSVPAKPTADKPVKLVYTPAPTDTWMKSQDVHIYVCLEMNNNGEWDKEKAPWNQTNLPVYKWKKESDGTVSYSFSDIKSYFKLTDAELQQVTGMFVILKNDKYQTSDKYIKFYKNVANAPKFNGTVKFSVIVPVGTKNVYVTGTFGKEGTDDFWKHADPKRQLKKVSDTKFEGTLTGVPANLEYLYVWGPRKDQTEFRIGHRPLGGRVQVTDKVDYWGDMTLSVTAPSGTREMYVSGTFNNWGFGKMVDSGNNTWTYHVAPGSLNGSDVIEYKYFSKNSTNAGEKRANRKVTFEGFATQYDEIRSWK